MKASVRTLLIEPQAVAREVLTRVLDATGDLRVVATCADFDQVLPQVGRLKPQLVVLGLDSDPARALGLIRALESAHPGLPVLPVSNSREADLILGSIRAGAREFLTLSAPVEECRAAIERLVAPLRAADAAGAAGSRCLAVVGATGGVGCTTLAVNLAAVLAHEFEQEVVLADFDLLLGVVDVCLDLVPDQTLADLARNIERLDPTLLKRSLLRHASGLYVLPGPPGLDEAMKLEPDSLQRVVELLVSVFPVVLLDLSKSFQASDSVALERADTILLVAHLEPACLRNTARLLSLFRQYEGLIDKVRIVANRVGSSPFEIGLKKAQEILKLPIEWQIVEAAKLCDASRSKGIPLETEAPGSRPHRAIQEIARAIFPGQATDRSRSKLGRLAASLF